MPRKIEYEFSTGRRKYGQMHNREVLRLAKSGLNQQGQGSTDSSNQSDYIPNKHFIKVSREVCIMLSIRDLLTIAELRVLLFIISKTDFLNVFIFHTKDIAYALNITPPTVSRALTKLIDLGLIQRSQEFIGFQVYTRLCWKGTKAAYSKHAEHESTFDFHDQVLMEFNADDVKEEQKIIRKGRTRYKTLRRKEKDRNYIKELKRLEEKLI